MKILVVDDHMPIRKLIRNELERDGYEVDEAEDGIKALLYMSSSSPAPDLITLDVEMPRLGGFEMLSKA